jgi:hypothetical protein
MPRVSLILCLCTTAILSLSSCAASSRSIPEKGILTPAKYSTQYFKPALSFTIDGYWVFRGQNYDYLDIAPLRSEIDFMGSTALGFFNVSRVYEPKDLFDEEGKKKIVPAPKGQDGMVRWLREHPSLSATNARLMYTGNAPAVQFDAVVSSVPKSRSSDCSSPCVPLFDVSGGPILFLEGERCRFFIVDVKGETVVIVYSGPTDPSDEFRKFEPAASGLLTTVEWVEQ